jgi:hypothetical protein
MSDTVAWVRDEHGSEWEERTEVQGEVECQRCGEVLELVAETESHCEGGDGRWHHDQYGPAQAVCCGLLYADWWEGCFVYRLDGTETGYRGERDEAGDA